MKTIAGGRARAVLLRDNPFRSGFVSVRKKLHRSYEVARIPAGSRLLFPWKSAIRFELSRDNLVQVPMKNEPIVVEQTFNASPAKIWKAITDRGEMKKWYFDVSDFHPESGFEFSFEGGTPEKKFLHLCRVTTVIPLRKISYTWKYKGYPGESEVTFELIEGDSLTQDRVTTVRLTHEGIESFPSQPEFARENFVRGWTEIIGKSLKNFVEK